MLDRFLNILDILTISSHGVYLVCGFPKGMGDIDCARIPVKAPREKHPQLNRKKVHPLNIQVVSNANLRTEVSLQSFYEVCMCMIPTFGIAIFCVDISINNSLGTRT